MSPGACPAHHIPPKAIKTWPSGHQEGPHHAIRPKGASHRGRVSSPSKGPPRQGAEPAGEKHQGKNIQEKTPNQSISREFGAGGHGRKGSSSLASSFQPKLASRRALPNAKHQHEGTLWLKRGRVRLKASRNGHLQGPNPCRTALCHGIVDFAGWEVPQVPKWCPTWSSSTWLRSNSQFPCLFP